MKRNKREQQKGNGETPKPVHIEFTHPTASAVAIAGTFNQWRPESTPMISLGEGRWMKDLVLSPGTYEYLIVVDGKWIADPAVKETAPNPYGGVNSLVTVHNHN